VKRVFFPSFLEIKFIHKKIFSKKSKKK